MHDQVTHHASPNVRRKAYTHPDQPYRSIASKPEGLSSSVRPATGKGRLNINRYECYSRDTSREGAHLTQVLRTRHNADMDSTKRISIDLLTVGMFIAGLDQPWYRTPFLLHKWLISNHPIRAPRYLLSVVVYHTIDIGGSKYKE